jgi:hypothetical protein
MVIRPTPEHPVVDVARKLLPLASSLQDAINTAETLEELIPIAERLQAKISFWGARWVEIMPSDDGQQLYPGTAFLLALIKRIHKIIDDSGRYSYIDDRKGFTLEEHEACRRLEFAIDRFFHADKMNVEQANIITRIFVVIRNVFKTHDRFDWTITIDFEQAGIIARIFALFMNIFFQMDDRFIWTDEKWGYNTQVLSRGDNLVWDHSQKRYVHCSEDNEALWKVS